MTGESPLSMMRAAPRLVRKSAPRGRRLWRFTVPVAVVVLAAGWSWLWSYAASIAQQAEAAWIQREAAVGRVYACGTQSIGGFPFSIVSRCAPAAGTFNDTHPPFDVRAAAVTFAADVFRPTLLSGTITGPVTLADPGQPPVFSADWTSAQIRLLGLPPEPQRIGVVLDKPRLDRVAGPGGGMLFAADSVDVDGRIIAGTAQNNPVIEATAHFAGATAPRFHPLLAEPIKGNVDAVLRGFRDFGPKPWPVLFQQMQANGGGIEIKSLRIERPDAIVIGSGTLKIKADGKLDGLMTVAVAGIDNIVPLLGIDQLIGQGIDRLTGGSGSPDQGLNTLDRLLPGLGGVVRQSATAGVIENIKKMGQPTTIDKQPAVALPLRFDDGVIYLGLVPVGVVPALF